MKHTSRLYLFAFLGLLLLGVRPALAQGPITIDTVVTNTLTAAETNRFTIPLTAGQTIYADAISGSINSYTWFLNAPSGASIFLDRHLDKELLIMPETGVYELGVFGRDGTGGTTEFGIYDVPVAVPQGIQLDQVVTNQTPTPGVTNIYTFSLTSPRQVFADAITGSTTGHRWSLTDPNGAIVFSTGNWTDPGQNVLSLTNAGVYRLLVDGNGDRTGETIFSLETVAANPVRSMTLDQVVSGEFLGSGEEQRFTLPIEAPLRVYANAISGSITGFSWSLIDPDGESVFLQTVYNDPSGNVFELTKSGIYEVWIDGNGDRTGPWSLAIHDVPTNPDLPLTYHSPVVGELTVPGEQQAYSFEGLAGETLAIERRIGSTTRLNWSLVDSSGTVVDSQSTFSPRLLDTPLPADGTYTLIIDGTGDGVGPYDITLHVVPQFPDQPIVLDQIVTDTFTEYFETRSYTIDLTAGTDLLFDEISNPSDTYARLEDPNGDRVFDFISNDHIENDLALTGTYTLRIRERNSVRTGAFSFRLSSTNAVPALPPMADLIVSEISFSPITQVANPATVTISWTVLNISTNPTSNGGWTDRVYVTKGADDMLRSDFIPMDTSLTPEGALRGDLLDARRLEVALIPRLGDLAPGASYNQQATVTLPAGFRGDFWAVVYADALNNEAELGDDAEENNATESNDIAGIEPAPRPGNSGGGFIELDVAEGTLLPANTPFLLSGCGRIIPEQLNVAFVIDNSFSTVGADDLDANFDGVIDERDDYNRDGTFGDIYDAEIGAVEILLNLLKAQGVEARVSILAFSGANVFQDLSGDFLNQTWISGTQDEDQNGVNDLVQTISAQPRVFGTDFIIASEGLAPILAIQPEAEATEVFFFTDGEASTPSLSPAIQTIGDAGVNFHAFQIGGNAVSTALATLANLIDGNPASSGESILVADPNDLAISVVASLNIAGLTVNGQGVESLDPSGCFFTPITLQPGTNLIPIVVYDTDGNAFTEMVTLIGEDPALVQEQDVSHQASLEVICSTWNPTTHDVLTELTVVNNSAYDLPTPLRIRFDGIAPSSVGTLPSGDLLIGDGSPLPPGGTSAVAEVSFTNPQDLRFLPNARILAPQNLPPIFTESPLALAAAGELWASELGVEDPDGDTVEVAIVLGPPTMNLSGTSLSWTPTLADVGQHEIQIQAVDGRGGVATLSFQLNVEDNPANRPPVFRSAPVTASNSGLAYEYLPEAVDPDGDTITFSLTAPAGFSLDASSGRVSATAPADGVYALTLTATDTEGAYAEQTWQIDIGSASANPHVPVFRSTPPLLAVPGETYLYFPLVQDADGDPITYSASVAPTGMIVNVSSGQVQWQPSLAQVGVHPVLLRAEDGNGGAGTQFYTVEVTTNAPNRAPIILSTPRFLGEANAPYDYAMRAVDPDGQIVDYQLIGGPAGMNFAAGTGDLSWTPTPAQIGSHPVTLHAADTDGASSEQSFLIEVRDTNTPPTIVSQPTLMLSVGASYGYAVEVVDPDPITFELTDGPAFLSIDPLGGLLSGSPDSGDLGPHSVGIRATDDRGASASQSFILTVVPDSSAPTVTLQVSPRYVDPGSPVSLTVTALDDVGVTTLSLTIDGNPVALDANGRASFTPLSPGLLAVLASASDAAGNTGEANDSIRVFDTGDTDEPVITFLSPTNQTRISAPTDVLATITDPSGNLDYYVLEYILASELPMIDTGAGFAYLLDSDGFTEITRGTSANGAAVNGVIGRFDPTMLPNDDYVLRISAFDINGIGRNEGVVVSVFGELKLGDFSLEFADYEMGLSGIPLRLIRTYNTLVRDREGDFGYGWCLSTQDADIRETVPDTGDDIFTASPILNGSRIYINTPDGRRVGFTFEPEFSRASYIGTLYRAKFTPDPGIKETLELPPELDIPFGLNSLGEARLFGIPLPFNPDRYVLTTRDELRYTYDQRKGLETIEDPAGNVLTFTDNGVTHSDGSSIPFIRDALGRITRIEFPDGNAMTYVYDDAGNLIENISPGGVSSSYAYLPGTHLLSEHKVPGKQPVTLEYDDMGRLVAVIEPDGSRIEQSFDPNTFTGTFLDANLNLTTFLYDERGNLIKETSPLGGETLHTYDTEDNRLSSTDPAGNTTTWTYDSGGRILTETIPDGGTTVRSYNPDGQVTTVSDALGNTSTITYAPNGHISQITNPLGDTLTYTYGPKGELLSITDFSGFTTTLTYGPNGPSLVNNDAGMVRAFTFDNRGLTTVSTDEDNHTVSLEYDPDANLKSVTDAQGNTLNRSMQDGLLNSETDPMARTTAYIYDINGRLDQVTRPDGETLRFVYDGNNNRTQVIDPLGNITHVAYDGLDRVIARTDAAGATESWTYNGSGLIATHTDRRGTERRFSYDGAGNLLTEEWFVGGALSETLNFTYDLAGKLLSASSSEATVSRSYNAAGHMIAETSDHLPGGGFRLDITRSGGGMPLTAMDQSGLTVSSTYVTHEHLSQRSWSSTAAGDAPDLRIDLARSGAGTLTQLDRFTDLAGTQSAGQSIYTYNTSKEVTAIEHRDAAAAILQQESATYNAASEPTAITRDGNAINLLLDGLGQVSGTTDALMNALESFSYDANGNRSGSEHLLGPANRLLQDADWQYAYDANGHVSAKTNRSSGVVHAFEFDPRNRLMAATVRDAGGSLQEDFAFGYDALDRLVRQTHNGSTRLITWNDEQPWAEWDASGTLLSRTLMSDQLNEVLAHWAPGQGLAFPLNDALQTPHRWVDASGSSLQQINYTAFGSPDSPAPIAGIGLSGHRYIPELDLYHARARMYDPASGRFLSEDPLGFDAGDANLYRYAGNNPFFATDPRGESAAIEYGLLACTIGTAVAAAYGPGNTINYTFRYVAEALEDAGNGSIPGDFNPPPPGGIWDWLPCGVGSLVP